MQTSKRGAIIILVCCVMVIVSSFYYKKQHEREVAVVPPPEITTPVVVKPAPIVLENTPWVWEYTILPNEKKVTAENNKFVLTLNPDGLSVTSTTDCNTLSSTYIKSAEILSFAPFGSSKMLCKKTQETIYKEQLELTTSYIIRGEELTINLNRDAGIMVFKKKTAGATTTPTN